MARAVRSDGAASADGVDGAFGGRRRNDKTEVMRLMNRGQSSSIVKETVVWHLLKETGL